MKPFIENISWSDTQDGIHSDAGPNSMLIQIWENEWKPPVPKYPFKETHKFNFLDNEPGDLIPGDIEAHKQLMTREQADEIISLLNKALDNNTNVIVHCVAGICRSGAIAEVGVMMGFADTGKWRQPNVWVKKLLLDALYESML